MSKVVSKMASYNPADPAALYIAAAMVSDMLHDEGADPSRLTVEPRERSRWTDNMVLLHLQYRVPTRRKAPYARASEQTIRDLVHNAVQS